jgi:hypothetical protein
MGKQNFSLYKNNQQEWSIICDKLTSLPIFMRSVWLNAVSKNWTVNTIYNDDNQLVGAIIFQVGSKYGFQTIMNPHMTPYHGLWISDQYVHKQKDKISKLKKISTLLIDSLPDSGYINIRLSPSINDIQEFKWKGYYPLVRYTYKLHRNTDLAKLWSSLDHKRRNEIVKARKDLYIEESDDIHQHYFVVLQTFKRAGEHHHVTIETYNSIFVGLNKTGNAKIFCVKDESHNVQASLLFTWDHSTAYLLSHGTIDKAHRGATSLLIWNAIEFTLQKQLDFDFEGSDIQRIEAFYRDFGGELTPYFQVIKVKNPFLRALVYAFKKL